MDMIATNFPVSAEVGQLIQSLLFFAFSAVMLFAATMVITARNPVHSVLFLILAFFNAAGLFVLLGAEFVAMTLVIVYVGAVAVLFLFVIMMLDINFKDLRQGISSHLPLALVVGAILMTELGMAVWGLKQTAAVPPPVANVPNTEAIGRVLYTDYIVPFQTAGLILLVAMIGAIVLTLRHRPGLQRQSSSAQINRRASDVLRVNKVGTGEGV